MRKCIIQMMNVNNSEIEAKFHVRDLSKVAARLAEVNANLTQPRTHEVNLRFDTPEHSLRQSGRVLRLRQDNKIRMTYKSASEKSDGILSRTEIEFAVEDFDKAKQFLEALGYKTLVMYEKFRTTYELNGTRIMLDELPYGNFIEIEGNSNQEIRSTADKLGLKWVTIEISYHALFERLCKARNLTIKDLSFENFNGMPISADELGIRPAD